MQKAGIALTNTPFYENMLTYYIKRIGGYLR